MLMSVCYHVVLQDTAIYLGAITQPSVVGEQPSSVPCSAVMLPSTKVVTRGLPPGHDPRPLTPWGSERKQLSKTKIKSLLSFCLYIFVKDMPDLVISCLGFKQISVVALIGVLSVVKALILDMTLALLIWSPSYCSSKCPTGLVQSWQ